MRKTMQLNLLLFIRTGRTFSGVTKNKDAESLGSTSMLTGTVVAKLESQKNSGSRIGDTSDDWMDYNLFICYGRYCELPSTVTR